RQALDALGGQGAGPAQALVTPAPEPPAPVVIRSVAERLYKIGSQEHAVNASEDRALQAFIGRPVMTERELIKESGVKDAATGLHRLLGKKKVGGAFALGLFPPGAKGNSWRGPLGAGRRPGR